ncbi:ATP-binding protein [Herbidospora daliensis]|uniref:ATP-binding protein n=1 Tax=Herbidospora daliensis TaxID=295585 RepID=UPI0007863427|nr:ATP-binding protein [Herbidospora daliensis]
MSEPPAALASYNQTLPGTDAAPRQAAQWIRTIAEHEQPDLADRAAEVVYALVASAARHTHERDQISVRAQMLDGGQLRVEVRDPAGRPTRPGPAVWDDVSRKVRGFGAQTTGSEHLAWVEIGPEVLAVRSR